MSNSDAAQRGEPPFSQNEGRRPSRQVHVSMEDYRQLLQSNCTNSEGQRCRCRHSGYWLGGTNSVNRFLTKDFLSGVMFVAFGMVTLYFGQNLAIGTAVRMGPGYVPRMLSMILLGLGLLICILALVNGGEEVEKPKWKPITLVTIGIVCFGLLLERAGLLPALAVLILISSLAGEEFKLLEVIGNIVVLSILCVVVFKVGLGMNIAVLEGVW